MKVKKITTIEDDLIVTSDDLFISTNSDDHGVSLRLKSEFCKKWGLTDEEEWIVLELMRKRCIQMNLKGESVESPRF